jgi:hypothetical protein
MSICSSCAVELADTTLLLLSCCESTIQDKMEEYADEIFDKLDNGAHMYFCGLKVRITRLPHQTFVLYGISH